MQFQGHILNQSGATNRHTHTHTRSQTDDVVVFHSAATLETSKPPEKAEGAWPHHGLAGPIELVVDVDVAHAVEEVAVDLAQVVVVGSLEKVQAAHVAQVRGELFCKNENAEKKTNKQTKHQTKQNKRQSVSFLFSTPPVGLRAVQERTSFGSITSCVTELKLILVKPSKT